MRGRWRHIVVTSTRFGASTCSGAAAGSSALPFTEPDTGSCAYTKADTGSHTSAIAQPNAGSCSGTSSCAYTNTDPRTSTHG